MSEVNKTFSVGKKYMKLETHDVFECYRQHSTNGNPVHVELRRLNATRLRVLYAVPVAILNPEDYIVVSDNIDPIPEDSDGFPALGDKVLVRDHKASLWEERIYMGQIFKANYKYFTVQLNQEEAYQRGSNVGASSWKYMKKCEPLECCEVTMEQIAEKFHISLDRLKITNK